MLLLILIVASLFFCAGYFVGSRESAKIVAALQSLESRFDVLRARIETGAAAVEEDVKKL